jgi:hypothetical protein
LTTEELPQSQSEIENENEDNESNRRPYFTYTPHELCSEILSDIQDLKDKAHSAKNLWDMAKLWYEMECKPTSTLIEMKLELLKIFLEKLEE